MDMVEKVARAMWDERRNDAARHGIELEEWGDGAVPQANNIFGEARAAIEAMRDVEPTDEMMAAMWSLSFTSTKHSFEACWRAMIDAALSNTREKDNG